VKNSFKDGVNISVVALLLFGLVLSVSNLFEQPDYSEFCKNIYPIPLEKTACNNSVTFVDCKGLTTIPVYDDSGCLSSYDCSSCQNDYESERKKVSQYKFLVELFFGFFTIVFVLLKDKGWNRIFSMGLIIGGLIIIFFSSVRYYDILNKYLRVLMFSLELLLFSFLIKKKFY